MKVEVDTREISRLEAENETLAALLAAVVSDKKGSTATVTREQLSAANGVALSIEPDESGSVTVTVGQR